MAALVVIVRAVVVAALAAALAVLGGPAPPAQAALECRDNLVMNFAPHEDDDILFLNPDIQTDIAAGRCVLTVFVTAGDAGLGEAYWRSREDGARAAAAHMAGVADEWTHDAITLGARSFAHDTLVGRPTVGLLFLRLPDGGSGGGFAANDGQSLQKLWQSTISSIGAVDRSATYSRSDLIWVLVGLMNRFRPTLLRAPDYLGRLGDGDHSDHHSSAYFIREAHYRYLYRHRLTGYLGYGVKNLPSNLTQAQTDAKLATFLAYAPHDVNVCQTAETCLASSNGPRFSRQYTVGSELGGVQNAARVGTVKASSQNTTTGQTAAKAVDGVVGGYPLATTREWATVGGRTGSWIEITWPGPHTLESVALYDRPNLNDRVTAGTLLFGDGSSIPIKALPNDGTASVVTFAPRRVTRLRFRVDAVSSNTRNVGLAEIQAFTTNVAPRAAVTASSQNTTTGQTAAKAVDGYPLGYPVATTREWATVGGRAGSWLKLTWPEPVRVSRVVLYDRPNANDQINGATLRFSDGSTIAVSSLPNEGTQRIISFSARDVTSVELVITEVSPTTRNIGLAEIQVQSG